MAGEKVWDRHSVKAEVERRGGNLSQIARDQGLNAAACRQALAGGHFSGAKAVAKFLGIPVRTLFPGLYTAQLAREDRIAKASASASQKRSPRADAARAS